MDAQATTCPEKRVNSKPRRYLTVVLAELPGAKAVEEIEALLPWRMTTEEVERRYAARPKPKGPAKKASA